MIIGNKEAVRLEGMLFCTSRRETSGREGDTINADGDSCERRALRLEEQ